MPVTSPWPHLPDLWRHGGEARHEPEVCTTCQGRGDRVAGPGPLLHLPAVHEVRRHRHRDQGPLRHLQRRRHDAPDQRYRRTSPPACATAARKLAGKGESGRRGGPAGDLYVVTRVSDSPLFKRRAKPRGRGARHDSRGRAGAEIEVPTLNGSKRIRAPRHPARHGAEAARRGSARLGGRGRGDIHYRLAIDVPTDALPGAARGGRRAGGRAGREPARTDLEGQARDGRRATGPTRPAAST